jgi:hypothetical protein
MGEVYRARDPRLGRDVAVKVVGADRAASAEAAARFEREWRTVAALQHPNIVALFDAGQQDGVTFAVMELAAGVTLRERLASGPLPPRKAVDIGVQIARGLAAAHAAGVVHRDLKPENVIVSPDGHAKILDFGLACPPDDPVGADVTTLTVPGTMLGTHGYMAPEQIRGDPLDARTDIFAFGAVLFELLSGRPAFAGAAGVDRLQGVLRDDPAFEQLPVSHPALRRIVQRCLEKRPDDRFRSAHDLAFALEAAGEEAQQGHSVSNTDRRTWTTWRRVLLVAPAAAALVAGVVIGRTWTGATGPPRAPATPIAVRSLIQAPPSEVLEMAFSPDGRTLAAVTASAPGRTAIWVRPAIGVTWRRIAETNMSYHAWCAWAPDSRSLAFTFVENGKAALRVLDIESGDARTVSDPTLPSATNGITHLAGARVGGDWSAQAGLLAGGDRLRVLAPGAASWTDVLAADPAVSLQLWPSFLDDGISYVFTQRSQDAGKRGIYLGTIGTRTARRLLPVEGHARVARSGDLVYVHGDTLLAAGLDVTTGRLRGEPRVIASGLPAIDGFTWFAVAPGGGLAFAAPSGDAGLELAQFDAAGQRVRTLGEPGPYYAVSLSPDGRSVLVQAGERFVVVELARGLAVPLSPPPADVSYGDGAWSPDAMHVALTSYRQPTTRNLAVMDVSTGRLTTLLQTDLARWPKAWSARSNEIVATKWEPWGASLWALRADDPARARRLSPEGPISVNDASLSPDETKIAYDTNETGALEIYVQSFERPQDRRRVSAHGGRLPQWSRDGRELYYVQPDGALVSVRVSHTLEIGVPVPRFRLPIDPSGRARQYVALPSGRGFVAIVPTRQDAPRFATLLSGWASTPR